MTVQYVGGLTIGDALPGLALPLIQITGDIQLRLNALLDFEVSITPPSLLADLQVSADINANIQAALTLGIEPPSIDVQASVMLDAIALLKLQLQIIKGLYDLFGFGVHVYNYTGQVDQLGGEFTTALAGGVPGGSGTDICDGLLWLATAPGAWAAIAALFKVTP